MLMGMCLKANGNTIKQMELEHIFMLMGLSTKENGKMICSTDKELRRGTMDRSFKGFTLMERSKGKGYINGQMGIIIIYIITLKLLKRSLYDGEWNDNKISGYVIKENILKLSN